MVGTLSPAKHTENPRAVRVHALPQRSVRCETSNRGAEFGLGNVLDDKGALGTVSTPQHPISGVQSEIRKNQVPTIVYDQSVSSTEKKKRHETVEQKDEKKRQERERGRRNSQNTSRLTHTTGS